MRIPFSQLATLFKVLEGGTAAPASDWSATVGSHHKADQSFTKHRRGGIDAAAAEAVAPAAADDLSQLTAAQLHSLLVRLVGKEHVPPLRPPVSAAQALQQQRSLATQVKRAMGEAPLGLVDDVMGTPPHRTNPTAGPRAACSGQAV